MSWFPRGYFPDLDVQLASERGRQGGEKGGRPLKKPFDFELKQAFLLYTLSCGNQHQARAELVKDLAETCKATPSAARGWLRSIGITRRK